MRAATENTQEVQLPGNRAFHLYETYGLPLDFMVDADTMLGIEFDDEGFENATSRGAGARAGFVEGRRAEDGESGVSRFA